MSVSIYDIARKAGVSPSTVSRALENHPRIGEATKRRIQEIAREMDYVPSTVAKSLATSKTWTIGIVLATIADPFMGRVVEGIEMVANDAGFNVFISNAHNDRQREIAVIKMLQKRRVDGIIVLASHVFDQYPSLFEHSRVPIVVINEQKPGKNMHFVAIDDVYGARLAVEHLLALGHRSIGFVGVTDRPRSNQYRFKGYLDTLEAADIPFNPALIFTSQGIQDHAQVGEASLEPLLAASATAVFCYNDMTALGLLAACHKKGVSVPDRLSVIGFDDIDVVSYTMPPLTTIRQPLLELGQRAMQMMLALVNGQQQENQVVPVRLVVRETTTSRLLDTYLEAVG